MDNSVARQRDDDSTMEEMESMSRVQWIISIMPIAYCIGIALLFRLPLLYHHAGEASLSISTIGSDATGFYEYTLPSASVVNVSVPTAWFALAVPAAAARKPASATVIPVIVSSPVSGAVNTLHLIGSIAFTATFAIDFTTGMSAGHNNPMRRGMASLLCIVNAMAMVTYLFYRLHMLPVHLSSWNNSPLLGARYVQWTCSCGTLLYMMGYMGRVPFHVRYRAIFFQVTMIVTGFFSSYLWHPLNIAMMVVSMLAWTKVMVYMHRSLCDAEQFCIHAEDAPRISFIRHYTLVVWTLFPLIWCLGEFSLIRSLTAEIFLSILVPDMCESSQASVDLGAKIIYSASLYWTNLLSFERFDLVKAISEATDFNDPDQAAKAQDRISSLQRMVSIIAPSAPAGADVIAAGSVSTSFASSAAAVGKIPASHVADLQPRLSDFQRRFLERIKSEFKQPLNSVIRMSSSVLSTQVDLHHREQLHITLSSAQTLLTNIDNMLALNDVEQQKEAAVGGSITELAQQAAGQQASEPFQLLAMLDALTDFGAQRAADKLQAIELVISFDPRSPVALSADFRRLFLVLRNLLDNSIKYTSSGFVLVHAAVVLASTPLDADRPVEAAVLASLKSERKASSKSKQAENAAAGDEASSQEYILQVIFKDSGDSSLFPHDAMRVASASNQESGVYARSNRESGIGVGLRVVRTLVGVMGGSLHVAKPDSSAESGVAYGETDVNSTRGTTITVRVPVRRLTDAAIAAAGFAPPASATASPTATARAEVIADQDSSELAVNGGGILQLPIALDAHPKQASSRQSPSSQKGRGGKHDSSSDFSSPSLSPQSSPGADRSTSPVWSEEGSDNAHGSLSPLRPFISRSPPVASDASPSDSSQSSFGFSPRSSGATMAAALSATAASKFRPVDVVICIELPLLRDVIASFVSLAGARVRIVQSSTQVAHAIMQGVDVLVLDAELLASNLELGSLVPSALRAPTALIEVHSLLSTDALMNIGADAPFDPESVGGARAAQTQTQGGRRSPTPANANASALSKSPPRGVAAGQATGNKSPTRGFGATSKQLMLSGVVRASVAGANAHLLRHFVFARPIKMSSLLQVLSDYVADVTRRRFASHA